MKRKKKKKSYIINYLFINFNEIKLKITFKSLKFFLKSSNFGAFKKFEIIIKFFIKWTIYSKIKMADDYTM